MAKKGKHPQSGEEFTIEFFRKKFGVTLSEEEARDARVRMTGLVQLLAEIASRNQS